MQLAEVDALPARDAVDDDVGGVAEDRGPMHGQRDADDREHEHGGDAQPLGREAVRAGAGSTLLKSFDFSTGIPTPKRCPRSTATR